MNPLSCESILQETCQRLGCWYMHRSMPDVLGGMPRQVLRLLWQAQQLMQHQLQNLHGIVLPVGNHAMLPKGCHHMLQCIKRRYALVFAIESHGFCK